MGHWGAVGPDLLLTLNHAGVVHRDRCWVRRDDKRVGPWAEVRAKQGHHPHDEYDQRRYPEPLNLARELDEAWKGFYGAKSAKFVIRVPKTMEVDADPRRLRQILLNLFSNAANARPKGLVLKIDAKVVDKMVEISVTDNGPGIAMRDLPHVFERFYRADQSRTRDTGGAGLGLSIVKTLVEAHGGGVSIKSGTGKGATVSFTLPLSK